MSHGRHLPALPLPALLCPAPTTTYHWIRVKIESCKFLTFPIYLYPPCIPVFYLLLSPVLAMHTGAQRGVAVVLAVDAALPAVHPGPDGHPGLLHDLGRGGRLQGNEAINEAMNAHIILSHLIVDWLCCYNHTIKYYHSCMDCPHGLPSWTTLMDYPHGLPSWTALMDCFQAFFFKASWRSIYLGTSMLTTFFSLLQLVLIFQWNTRYLHLSNYLFSLGDDVISAYISGIQFLPVCIMYMQLCPAGAEGASYALLTTFGNIALVCASDVGFLLAGVWDVSQTTFPVDSVSTCLIQRVTNFLYFTVNGFAVCFSVVIGFEYCAA